MKCPSCKILLRRIDNHGIALDECPECGGVWFDASELKKVIDSTDNALRWIDFNIFEQEDEKFAHSVQGEMCPQCVRPLAQFIYKNSGAAIGICPSCKGAWLAKGELSKIIGSLEDMIARESLAQYEHDAARQFAEIFNGPKGVVSETKDFFAVAKLLEYRLFVEHPKLLAALANIENHLPLK